MNWRFTLLSVTLLGLSGLPPESRIGAAEVAQVSLPSLLQELVDRDAVARWPAPAYTCKQFSSYDRRRAGPDQPDWFANSDATQYIRVEQNAGRQEHVMMDADGPGAIVRFWLTTQVKTGKLRIYLDGSETAAIVFPAYDLMQGDLKIGSPLLIPHTSYRAEGGGNTLYLPLPYAKHCKVTWEEQHPGSPRYYQINYRTYPAGTPVETFTMAGLEAARATIRRVGRGLLEPAAFDGGKTARIKQAIEPGQQASMDLPAGPAAVRRLEVRLTPADEADPAQALRSTVLLIEFDGQQCVWCPLGDFSGSGVGGRPLASWYRSVDEKGLITCRWVMPYQKTARATLLNLGQEKIDVLLAAGVGDWKWDDRSLHFHTTWRQQVDIPTRTPQDWNFLTVRGQGVLVGDTLAVYNPLATWYGEGNEKIWVDAESFPSHLGTGTEDYYNASWAPVVVYHTPFASAPRADTNSSQGHNTFTRTRNLDGIPFTGKLRFDMEIIPWAAGTVDYAATTYWYGRPGASASVGPLPKEAARPLQLPPGGNKVRLSPPMGWNSYTGYSIAVTEAELLKNIDFLSEKLLRYGYDTVTVDNGWFLSGQGEGVTMALDGFGRPESHPHFFPHGLKYTIDYAHKKGVKFGIWLLRGINRRAVEENLPVEGTKYRMRDIVNLKSACPWAAAPWWNYGVDMTKPGAQEYYDGLVKKYAEMGVDFIKFDDIVPNPAEVAAVAKAIKKCGRPIVLSLSPGDDIKVAHSDAYKKANMVRITSDIWDNRGSLETAFKRWEEMQAYTGPEVGSFLDMDMVCFGRLNLVNQDGGWDCHFSKDQKRTFMVQRALAASPLMLGGVLYRIDDFSMSLFTHAEILKCDQNGVIGRLVHRDGRLDVWKTPEKDNDANGWIGLFNRDGSKKMNVELSTKDLGLNPEQTYVLKNLWTGEVLPLAGKPVFEIPADGVVFLKYEQGKKP